MIYLLKSWDNFHFCEYSVKFHKVKSIKIKSVTANTNTRKYQGNRDRFCCEKYTFGLYISGIWQIILHHFVYSTTMVWWFFAEFKLSMSLKSPLVKVYQKPLEKKKWNCGSIPKKSKEKLSEMPLQLQLYTCMPQRRRPRVRDVVELHFWDWLAIFLGLASSPCKRDPTFRSRMQG